jgi:hypothetical protein
VRSGKDGGTEPNGVPVIPNVKVVVDGQPALDMLLFFKREKGGAFLNGKRVEMSLELVQKLDMDKGYTQKHEHRCDRPASHWLRF